MQSGSEPRSTSCKQQTKVRTNDEFQIREQVGLTTMKHARNESDRQKLTAGSISLVTDPAMRPILYALPTSPRCFARVRSNG